MFLGNLTLGLCGFVVAANGFLATPVWAADAKAISKKVRNVFALTSDGSLIRGAQPSSKNVGVLVEAGVEEVLILKVDTKGEVAREIEALLAAGLPEDRVHHLLMQWNKPDVANTCEQAATALQIITDAQAEGRSLYFHCTAGEDRTGMVAGLYRIFTEGIEVDDAFENELCARGYADGHARKPSHIASTIHRSLTPLFFELAERLKSANENGEVLPSPSKLCRGIEKSVSESTATGTRCPKH
mgnify:CR=1 FL=1